MSSKKPQSPSIQVLGNLSVVRSRLAQFTSSTSSTVSLNHPTRSSSPHRTSSGSRADTLSSTSNHRLARLSVSAPTSPVSIRRVGARQHLLNLSGKNQHGFANRQLEDTESIIDMYRAKTPIPQSSSIRVSIQHANAEHDLTMHDETGSKISVEDYQPPLDDTAQEYTAPQVHPLVSLIEERAQTQCSSTDRLSTQISSLQNDISEMANELRKVLLGQSGEPILSEICTRLGRLGKNENSDDVANLNGGTAIGGIDGKQILNNIEELKSSLHTGFPLVLGKIEEITQVESIRVIWES